jgi:membrane associated rhomboid family serine protease
VVIPVYDDNPTRNRPYITWALIAISVLAFLLSPVARGPVFGEASTAQLCRQQAYFLEYGAVPAELTRNRPLDYTVGAEAGPGQCFQVAPDYRKRPWLSAITTIFVHGGWAHLLGNMLFLWVFGNNVEDRFGRLKFLLFYLGVGLLSTYAYALTRPDATEPLVGASGAISGVLGAYLLLFPRAKVLSLVSFLFFFPLRLPAWLVLGFYFALQAFYAYGVGLAGGGAVAYLVHVVGFVLGVAVVLAAGRRLRPPPPPPPPRFAY